MEQHIFGREAELKVLQRLLDSKKPEFLAVYGRRRVGKTYLIHEFFKDKGFYFPITGSNHTGKKLQLRKFYRELKGKFQLPSNSSVPKDWDEALFLLKEIVSQVDPSRKVILFFDELPWLASNRSGFLPALEYLWNQHFSRMNNVLLIVCGSAANWIIKKVIRNRGGLYGRLTEIMKLSAFTLGETERFLLSHQVKLSRKQIVELYLILGGIAKYLTFIHPGESVAQAIDRICFTPQGQLVGEFSTLYQSLFDDSEVHMRIIEALARKKSGISRAELLGGLHIPSGGYAFSILDELEESGFIATCREFQKKTKDKKLRLIDEYSYFYTTWMEEVKGSVLLGSDANYWLKMQADPRWKTWSGYAFESLCFKHIAQIKKALGIAAVMTQDSQWNYRPKKESERGAQIDLLIDRKDDCINLCEIKFHHGPFVIDQQYAKELERKVNVFREETKTTKTIFLTMITPFGIEKNEYSTELVNCEVILDDLFV